MDKNIKVYRLLPLLGILFLGGCMHTNTADLITLMSPSSLPYFDHSKLIQVSSYDTTGGNDDRIVIPAGKKATILNVVGPGMITRIWMTIDSRDPHFLRRIVMRIYWDGEEHPSVEVPIGDFFGNGFRYTHYVSQFLGMTSGGYVCYFPMPFERLARIEIINETGKDVLALYYQINYHKFEAALGNNVAYFHALWNRSICTDYDSNYTGLHAVGRGHVVGMSLNAQSYDGNFGFLEGDEMIYVDGEKKPSIHGTGTEDYFSSGWYFSTGEYSGPYHGLVYKDDSLARIAAYRLHIPDQIPFRKSVIFTMEHGHNNKSVVDYATTIYWYQSEPHLPFPPLLKSGQLIPLRVVKPGNIIEAEHLNFNLNGLTAATVDMSDWGPDWSKNNQMVIYGKPGAEFSLTLNNLEELYYNLTLFYSRAPDFRNDEIWVNGEKRGTLSGYSPYILPDGKIVAKDIQNLNGSITMTFKVTGKVPDATGYNTGIDGILLEPVRKYIPDWFIIGPFPNRRLSETQRLGIDSIYAPELEIDIKREYHGYDGKLVHWRYFRTPESGYFSLYKLVTPNELVVTYALTYIWSPDVRTESLFLGTDDGAKLFLNNKLLYRYLGVRVAEPDQVRLDLSLKPGWNKLLLKIENNFGGYGFYARLLDRTKSLIVSAEQKGK